MYVLIWLNLNLLSAKHNSDDHDDAIVTMRKYTESCWSIVIAHLFHSLTGKSFNAIQVNMSDKIINLRQDRNQDKTCITKQNDKK